MDLLLSGTSGRLLESKNGSAWCKASAQEEACFRLVGTEANIQKGKKVLHVEFGRTEPFYLKIMYKIAALFGASRNEGLTLHFPKQDCDIVMCHFLRLHYTKICYLSPYLS